MGTSRRPRAVVARPYVPDAGDLVWLTFDPQAGHEQRGRRPEAGIDGAPADGDHTTYADEVADDDGMEPERPAVADEQLDLPYDQEADQ